MDIREVLLYRHSKAITSQVINYIDHDTDRLNTLLTLFLHDNDPIVRQRASWVIGHIGVDTPTLIRPHLHDIVENFTLTGHHDAIYRNTVRLLQFIEIPTELQGKVATTCFDFLGNPKTAIAIKAFSMTILYNISNKEPDLKPELKLVLEDLIPYASKGVKNKATKLIAILNKEIN